MNRHVHQLKSMVDIFDLLGDSIELDRVTLDKKSVEVEVLMTARVAGFNGDFASVACALHAMIREAVAAAPKGGTIIVTAQVSADSDLALGIACHDADFAALDIEGLCELINQPDPLNGAEAPNTPYWRGGAPTRDAQIAIEPLPYGGNRASLTIPAHRLVWTDSLVA
jgi:hypothetical protein